ncbi:hypothetical protein [uncultured Corynebacterium sp.]|uniref:hypothetical protein n=1 Tax=uncultured Corynebacterium sp. TaxID=159447 RepID=UPI0025E149E7|nr:hypothetical protein [uncultured Corynebacterium sp.]
MTSLPQATDARPRRVASLAALIGAGLLLQAGDGDPAEVSGDIPAAGPVTQVTAELARMDGDRDVADTWIGSLPEAVFDALDYRPVVDADGFPANPDGRCSSPVPLPERFEPPCRTHDLGYDLLRVAHEEGEALPQELRPALDRQLGNRISTSCPVGIVAGAGCRGLGAVVDVVVGVNTWRQGNGAPVAEDLPWPTPG